MFHKFLKYISQSISGMIGVSVYILADTFFISYKCGADGLRSGLRNRFDDRNRLRHTIQYQHSPRFTFELLFYPVHLLVSHMQHSFYAHRNLHSA